MFSEKKISVALFVENVSLLPGKSISNSVQTKLIRMFPMGLTRSRNSLISRGRYFRWKNFFNEKIRITNE